MQSASASAEVIVTTSRGDVRGRHVIDAVGERLVFLGIPYAEPPIDTRRFASPEPRAPWSGVRDALEHGPTPQRPPNDPNSLIPEPSVPGTDTLSVNVWTPSTTGAAPVLVYVHGGGYVEGSPASPWYDGSAFARDGVVTVTLSYRLGFDGFAHIPGAPDNRGLLDVLAALAWVRDEIGAFGGDASRVTITGQSAGAGIVLSLLSSTAAAGLFHAAWAMSPALTDIPLDVARARSLRVAELAGVTCDREGFTAVPERRLRQLQAKAIAASGLRDRIAHVRSMLDAGPSWGPVIDGSILTTDTLSSIRSGVGDDIPLVVGSLDDEFTFGMRAARAPLAVVPKRLALGLLGVPSRRSTAWLRAGRRRSRPRRIGTAWTIGRMISDLVFRRTVLRTLDARTAAPRGRAATWAYRFSWASPVKGWAIHCLDVPFFFDVLHDDSVSRLLGAARPRDLADAVHGAAVRLVRSKAPGWSAWSASEGDTRVFDVDRVSAAQGGVERDGYADVRPLI